ncbi:Uncharacterised protein [Achromobacter sp. 2789STDY5608628]|nr:Uncharacterised protein [Achromobacter sp. 2789STDY5608628]
MIALLFFAAAAGVYAMARGIDFIAAHLRRTDPWSPTA